MRAARMGDQISHGPGMLAMVGGAMVGAVLGAAAVTATAATGGLALFAVVGGCVAGGGLAGGSLARGIMAAFDLPDPTTGAIAIGSPNVLINSRPAVRAGLDMAACSGLGGSNHYPIPTAIIAEGAKTVLVNGVPLARVSMKLVCGAAVKSGSDDVLVGGPSAMVVPVVSAEDILESALGVLGLAALGAGALSAALVGGALALAQYGAAAAAFQVGFTKLHDWGESLGKGWGDILTGVTAFALMGAAARSGNQRLTELDEVLRNPAAASRPQLLRAMRHVAREGDVSTPKDGLYLWSGGGMKGAGGTAMANAEANGGRTLEMTEAGQQLSKLSEHLGPWEELTPAEQAESQAAWTDVSERLASNASGNVNIVVDTPKVRDGAIVFDELVRLEDNKAVTGVTLTDTSGNVLSDGSASDALAALKAATGK